MQTPRLAASLAIIAAISITTSAHAGPPTLKDVRRAPDLRAALKLAKRVPAVRTALARGKALTLAQESPTQHSIGAGKFRSATSNRYEQAGINAVLQLHGGPFGPKVQVRARALWVYGYDAPARLPGTREPSPTHLVTEMLRAQKGEVLWKGKQLPGSDVLVRGEGWQMKWTRERHFSVPTWRGSKALRLVQGTWRGLTPKTLADALGQALADGPQ